MSNTPKLSVSRNKGNGVVGRIFFLDLGAGRVLSANPDGSDLKTLVSEGRKLPDGLAIDVKAGHMYWTNMGNPKANDGTVFRSDLDGRNMTSIIAPGGPFTPKQLQIDSSDRTLYWSDGAGTLYWTQKGGDNAGEGSILRANLDVPKGLTPTNRTDIEVLYDKLPEPIDLDLDLKSRMLYWTDRGNPPRGN